MAKELKYRIVVVGQKFALTALKKFQRAALTVAKSIGSAFKKVLRIGAFLAGGGIVAAGIAAIKASASYEMLQVRLEAVLGSGKKAAVMFDELRRFAAGTPLQLEDLIKAKIILEGVGVSGKKAFKGVAETAAVMGKSIEEVALAVASLENETLKRLGIKLNQTGDTFKFAFRNKAGKEITAVAKSAEEAREMLTSIFSVKFGGGLEKASRTLNGLVSTFRDKMKDALALIGDQMLPTIKSGFETANAALSKLTGSGLLKTPQGLKTLFGHLGAIIVAAFSDGAALVSYSITQALASKGIHRPAFGVGAKMARLRGETLPGDKPPAATALRSELDAFGETLNKPGPSAGSERSIIDAIVNSPRIMAAAAGAGAAAAANGAGSGKYSNLGYGDLVARANKGAILGGAKSNPMFVQEVNPRGAGLV